MNERRNGGAGANMSAGSPSHWLDEMRLVGQNLLLIARLVGDDPLRGCPNACVY